MRQVTPIAPKHQLKDMMAGKSFVTNVVSVLSVSKPQYPGPNAPIWEIPNYKPYITWVFMG